MWSDLFDKKIELKRRVHRKIAAGVEAAPDHQSLKKPISRTTGVDLI